MSLLSHSIEVAVYYAAMLAWGACLVPLTGFEPASTRLKVEDPRPVRRQRHCKTIYGTVRGIRTPVCLDENQVS